MNRVETQDWGAQEWEARRNPPPPKKIVPLSLPSLHLRPVPERRWIVRDWLPVRQVTLNYADGGIGKTLLAMQLMAATALSAPWCGLPVDPCASVGLFSEDDETEIHIRMDAIRRSYGVEFTDLAHVHPIDATGADNILAHFDGNHMLPTPRFTQLRECILDTKARLAVIDTAATTFGGNENDRSQVTQFVGSLLTSLAQEMDGAVLLNAHPSVSGIANGDLRSGSTGWNNSARSRWAMTRPEGEDGKPQLDSSERILTRRKSNAAAAGETLALAWQEGVFVAKEAPGSVGAGSRKAAAEAAFLAALRASPRPASSDIRASNYAPRMFYATPQAADFRIPEIAEAMRNLMGRGCIVQVEHRIDYKTRYMLKEAE
jgi:RecA-family ATPase